MRIRLAGHLGFVAGEAECNLRVEGPIAEDELLLVLGQMYPELGPYLRGGRILVLRNGLRLTRRHQVSDGDDIEIAVTEEEEYFGEH